MAKVEVNTVEDEHTRYMTEVCTNTNKDQKYITINPSGSFYNSGFLNVMQDILNFEVFPDDIWIVTFPKSGTTWTQEMVWLLVNGLNFEEAKSVSLNDRCPFLEISGLLSDNANLNVLRTGEKTSIQRSAELARPRCIKSHLPVDLLPHQLWTVKPKIIYVSRDPRDAAVSFHSHHRVFNGYQGTLDKFLEAFLANRVTYTPYWKHNLDFLKKKGEPNILFNTYEEMKKDLLAVVTKTSSFLGKKYSEEQLKALCEHLSFKSMKENKMVNYEDVALMLNGGVEPKDGVKFMRSGVSGGWKTSMPQHLKDRFEEWNKEHLKDVQKSEVPFLQE